jgi:hypothetical protein
VRESLADHPSRSLCLLDSADYYERIHPVVPNAIALRGPVIVAPGSSSALRQASQKSRVVPIVRGFATRAITS